MVYNRWGNIVFETNNPQNGWDGSFRGEDCPVGTYSYKIVFKFQNSEKKEIVVGHVNLIR